MSDKDRPSMHVCTSCERCLTANSDWICYYCRTLPPDHATPSSCEECGIGFSSHARTCSRWVPEEQRPPSAKRPNPRLANDGVTHDFQAQEERHSAHERPPSLWPPFYPDRDPVLDADPRDLRRAGEVSVLLAKEGLADPSLILRALHATRLEATAEARMGQATVASRGFGKTTAMLRSAYESVLRDGIDVRIVGHDFDVVLSREEHVTRNISGERRMANPSQNQKKDACDDCPVCESMLEHGAVTYHVDQLRRTLGLREGKDTADNIARKAVLAIHDLRTAKPKDTEVLGYKVGTLRAVIDWLRSGGPDARARGTSAHEEGVQPIYNMLAEALESGAWRRSR